MLFGYLFSPDDDARDVQKHDEDKRNERQLIQRTVKKAVIRRNVVENVGKLRNDQKCEVHAHQCYHRVEEQVAFELFARAMQNKDRRHKNQHHNKERFKEINDSFSRRLCGIVVEDQRQKASCGA